MSLAHAGGQESENGSEAAAPHGASASDWWGGYVLDRNVCEIPSHTAYLSLLSSLRAVSHRLHSAPPLPSGPTEGYDVQSPLSWLGIAESSARKIFAHHRCLVARRVRLCRL